MWMSFSTKTLNHPPIWFVLFQMPLQIFGLLIFWKSQSILHLLRKIILVTYESDQGIKDFSELGTSQGKQSTSKNVQKKKKTTTSPVLVIQAS